MKDNKIAFILISIVIVIIAIAVGMYSYAIKHKPQLLDATVNVESQSFLVTGRRLEKVNVMIVPTGTSITKEDHQILTSMILTTDDKNSQIWTAHVPTQQFLAASIYIEGFGADDTSIGTKVLPYEGATEIYNMFNQFWTPLKAAATSTVRTQ